MRRQRKQTKPWSETEARRVLKEQAASGENVWTFATKRGLVPERVYRWKRKLGAGGSKAKKEVSQERRIRFAEVSRPVGGRSIETEQREKERLEVVLANGRRISVPSGFSGEDMERLVVVLEGAVC